MIVKCTESHTDSIELRQQAKYWQAQHGRAVNRESSLREQVRELKKIDRQREALQAKLIRENEELRARVAWLMKQVFGRKSEKTDKTPDGTQKGEDNDLPAPPPRPRGAGRPRGKQPGAEGHGRKLHENLPVEEILHELPEEEQCCPICKKGFDVFPGTEDSEEIHWEVRLIRHRHKRTRYKPTCDCGAVPGIVAAPPQPKLIPKGKFTAGFWVRTLLEKYLFQRPLHRVRKALELEGLTVSQGTLTGGLKRIGEFLQPLYARILERNRAADHWHMDETRWSVFEEIAGKIGHRWWLWVSVTRDTCAYILDPSRSAEVPRTHLGENAEGIINADRYAAYKTLLGRLRIAFCWSHVRRDFKRIRDGYGRLQAWGEKWVTRINGVFHQNCRRLEALSDPETFALENRALRVAVNAVAETRDQELADDTLHPKQRKALVSLRNHWEGLTIFVDHPEVPMDNNEAERRLRNPVVGRKNYYGSGSVWSGALAAMLFTIFQTLLLNNIDPLKWLLAYFEACAQCGGQPPENIDDYLPWNLTEEQRTIWLLPGGIP